jgi:hypothetical protein
VGATKVAASSPPTSLCVQRASVAEPRSITCTSLGEVALFRLNASRFPSGENAMPPITPIGRAGRRISLCDGNDSTCSLLMPSSLLT